MTNMLMWVTLALLSGPADSQIEQIDSQYTRLDDCRRIKSGRGGEDWILVRCRGYGDIRIWSIVTDSTRARLGFGRNLNLSGTFEPAVPDDRRMVEWRGITARGKFKPFAVIIRTSWPGETASFLTIYRLRVDGTSCIIGHTDGSNEVARSIADQSIQRFTCTQEPRQR